MAQERFLVRVIKDKIVVEQPHHHSLGYLLELEKTKWSKFLRLPNFVVINQRDYLVLQVGGRYAQRIK